jgi:hypothetical protein
MQDLLMAVIVVGGFSLIFMTIFGYFAYVRYLSHKETMALAEKGLLKPEQVVQYNGGGHGRDRKLLNRAIVLIAIGLALCLGLFPIGFVAGDDFPLFLGPWMLGGFIPLFFGIALLIIYLLPMLPSLLDQFSTIARSQTTNAAPSDSQRSSITQPSADDSQPR